MKSDLLPRFQRRLQVRRRNLRKEAKLRRDGRHSPRPSPRDRLRRPPQKIKPSFARIAKEVDPNKTPQEVLAELATLHPAPDKLLSTFNDTFASLIEFINTHHIITIPSKVEPTLEETPPFMRATTSASMDPPGPSKPAPPRPTSTSPCLKNPGHPNTSPNTWPSSTSAPSSAPASTKPTPATTSSSYGSRSSPSKIRQVLGANTNIEGWAHYTEQMMLDQGYGQPGAGAKDEREAKLIRLGQIQDALLRDARFVNSIKLHTGQFTFDQAVNFFVTDGYQSHSVALVETKRGTADATYLYYTLGKLEIMKLRADMMQKQGAAFNLQTFHDNFMRQGFAPIKIVRKAMLHDDSPSSLTQPALLEQDADRL